jgi:hypothetical protein
VTQDLVQVEKDLQALSSSVFDEYQRAKESLQGIWGDEELAVWAREVLDISQKASRSPDVLVECLRASPGVAKYLTLPYFLQWLGAGREMVSDAPVIAHAYYMAGPESVPHVRPRNIPRWAALGRDLYKGTWNSTTLATRFFQLSPTLLKQVPFWDVEYFATVLEAMSRKSSDLACECLTDGSKLLAVMGKEREAFLALCRTVTESNWRDLRQVLATAPDVTAYLHEDQRVKFYSLLDRMVQEGQQDVALLLREMANTLGSMPVAYWDRIFDYCGEVVQVNGDAVMCLLRSLPRVSERVEWERVESWVDRGVALLRENKEGGLSYLRMESSSSEKFLEALSSAQELEHVRQVLQLYCRALAGQQVDISSSEELADKGIGWVEESQATTDGAKVYLPPQVDRYQDKVQNFGWFKIVATHQAGHLEFNSFGLTFDRPSRLFKNLRWEAEDSGSGLLPQPENDESKAGAPAALLTDMGRFFNLFRERQLALDVFTAVEDCRLDYRIKSEYVGLATAYAQAQKEALTERPPVEGLPLRQALIELLIQLSLDQKGKLLIPKSYAREATLLIKIVSRLRDAKATIEDSAEAALRVYAVLSKLPNEILDSSEWQEQDLDSSSDYSEDEFDDVMSDLSKRQPQMQPSEGDEVQYESPKEVEFRGGFKPEMVQILKQLRMLRPDEITKEQLEELLKNSVELDLKQENIQLSNEMQSLIENLMKETGKKLEKKDEGDGSGQIGHAEEQGGALEEADETTAVYDEWDFRVGDYKPRWCLVHEKPAEEGDTRFFDGVLAEYAALMAEIKRQFEMVMPERMKKVRRIEDGEDLELDAVIEAEMDRRMGITPSDKIYWRRNKVERDVAVVFLVDMSASTAEAVEDAGSVERDRDHLSGAPLIPAAASQKPRGNGIRRNYKRIIDLEKESTVLLIQALETIGDTYGIYGFSGYGRENVEFYVIKDVGEGYSDKVKKRLDKMSPLHATRMGPAIRHAISKLENQDAKTKFLFLISDGRPQDRGYSREGVERDYAVNDTHMALQEARQKGITPFCLTVDKNGHDYLKAMCGDMGYEVLADIRMLPRRLPLLYKTLTL